MSEAELTFLQEHSLEKLRKQLQGVSKKAIKLLEDTMNNEKEDLKVRMSAANKLVEYSVSVSDMIERSNLQRTILEIKAKGSSFNGNIRNLPQQDDKPKALYNPNEVMRVGDNRLEDEIVDMSTVRSVE